MNYKVPIVSKKNRLRPKKSEVNRLIADNKLLKLLVKKNKNHSFEQGLENTINWIKKK